MSLIKPFNGIRPKKNLAKHVTSPNISYIDNYKPNKKLNFLNLLNTTEINKSKKILKSLMDKSIIQEDKSRHFYLYRITYKNKKLLGIVGKINLDNYDDKKILGHEETFVDRIKKRKEQLLQFNCQISPIYTTYKSTRGSLKKLRNIFNFKPDYNFKSKDNCRHELWVVRNTNKEELLKKYLQKIKKIYICDGHHRIQAMLKSRKKISPMVIAFPYKQVQILDYNRVVKTNIKIDKIKEIISRNFSLNISKKEAEELIEAYFSQFPKIKGFLDKIVDDATTNTFTETLYGRKRYIKELASSNFQLKAMGKRIAMNAPIQGTASDIMKIAMIKLNKEIQKIKSTDLLLQIHDEIIIQTPKESANKVSKIVKKEMEGASKLKVPLFVDIKENINLSNLN